MSNSHNYRIIVEPLSEADGGGWLATVPDLPGCMSDGRTPVEAVHSVQDAIMEWLEEAYALRRGVPEPTPRKAQSAA